MKTLTPNRQKNQERAFYWVAPEALDNLAEEIAEANRRRTALRDSLLQPPTVPAVRLSEASLDQLRESNRTFLETRRQQAALRISKPAKRGHPIRATLILIIAIGLVSTLATIATTVRF